MSRVALSDLVSTFSPLAREADVSLEEYLRAVSGSVSIPCDGLFGSQLALYLLMNGCKNVDDIYINILRAPNMTALQSRGSAESAEEPSSSSTTALFRSSEDAALHSEVRTSLPEQPSSVDMRQVSHPDEVLATGPQQETALLPSDTSFTSVPLTPFTFYPDAPVTAVGYPCSIPINSLDQMMEQLLAPDSVSLPQPPPPRPRLPSPPVPVAMAATEALVAVNDSDSESEATSFASISFLPDQTLVEDLHEHCMFGGPETRSFRGRFGSTATILSSHILTSSRCQLTNFHLFRRPRNCVDGLPKRKRHDGSELMLVYKHMYPLSHLNPTAAVDRISSIISDLLCHPSISDLFIPVVEFVRVEATRFEIHFYGVSDDVRKFLSHRGPASRPSPVSYCLSSDSAEESDDYRNDNPSDSSSDSSFAPRRVIETVPSRPSAPRKVVRPEKESPSSTTQRPRVKYSDARPASCQRCQERHLACRGEGEACASCIKAKAKCEPGIRRFGKRKVPSGPVQQPADAKRPKPV